MSLNASKLQSETIVGSDTFFIFESSDNRDTVQDKTLFKLFIRNKLK